MKGKNEETGVNRVGNKRSDITFERARCTLMEICSEYGFRAIYDRSPLRVHHNFPSIAIRGTRWSVYCTTRPSSSSYSSSSFLPPLCLSLPASISDRCALDKRKNLRTILFLACVTRFPEEVEGEGGVCKYTYRKRGQAPDLKQSGVCYPAKRYTRKY